MVSKILDTSSYSYIKIPSRIQNYNLFSKDTIYQSNDINFGWNQSPYGTFYPNSDINICAEYCYNKSDCNYFQINPRTNECYLKTTIKNPDQTLNSAVARVDQQEVGNLTYTKRVPNYKLLTNITIHNDKRLNTSPNLFKASPIEIGTKYSYNPVYDGLTDINTDKYFRLSSADFVGNDLIQIPNSNITSCGQYCDANIFCDTFQLDTNTNVCYLKTKPTNPYPSNSMLVYHKNIPDYTFYTSDINYPGEDVEYGQISNQTVKQCADMCTQVSTLCTAFIHDYDNKCLLKKKLKTDDGNPEYGQYNKAAYVRKESLLSGNSDAGNSNSGNSDAVYD